MVVHLVTVHFIDGQFTLCGSQISIVRCETGEPNPFVQVLRCPCRSSLDASSSGFSNCFVHSETSFDILGKVVFVGEDDPESGCILDGLAGALRLMGHHGVSGVPENTDIAIVEAGVWLMHVQAPGHTINGVLEEVHTVGIQLVVTAGEDVRYWNLFKYETFLLVLC